MPLLYTYKCMQSVHALHMHAHAKYLTSLYIVHSTLTHTYRHSHTLATHSPRMLREIDHAKKTKWFTTTRDCETKTLEKCDNLMRRYKNHCKLIFVFGILFRKINLQLSKIQFQIILLRWGRKSNQVSASIEFYLR